MITKASPTSAILILALIIVNVQCEAGAEPPPSDPSGQDVLDMAASEQAAMLSSNSHKVVASGWPSTSSMWPSIDTAETTQTNSSHWSKMVEPFIYADKSRNNDYSLLLAINETVLNILKSHSKPMAVNLSFEYYFNHDPKVTSLPGIKIEVERKEFKYLEPKGQIQARMWTRFNQRLPDTDPRQFEKSDWLKFSLVNRESPSLTAIRRLKVEFLVNTAQANVQSNTSENSNLQKKPVEPKKEEPVEVNEPNLQNVPPEPSSEQIPNYSPEPTRRPAIEQTFQSDRPTRDPDEPRPNRFPSPEPLGPEEVEPDAAPSNALDTQIKPVHVKKTGWWGKRRRKREVGNNPSNKTNLQESIVLTCYQSDLCDWKADSGEAIQWSLARQPPSTNSVQSGYYYVSNINSYGDLSKVLHLSLNQTDSATIADQNSDHCLELAFYVTERAYLNLYRYTRLSSKDDKDSWIKGNLLMTWAPTIASMERDKNALAWRGSLPRSILPAMENGQNGWTVETLCFGDFFSDLKECGAGKCALGFEMMLGQQVVAPRTSEERSTENQSEVAEIVLIDRSAMFTEQVVGVALLRDHSSNVPIRASRPKWLETWQRDEVEPHDFWKFYPKMDYKINQNNISLVNFYDNAHYFIESDWLNVDSNLDFTASLVIDLDPAGFNETTFNNSLNALTSQHIDGTGLTSDNTVFNLIVSTKLVDSSFNSIYTTNSTVDWVLKNNLYLSNLSLPITEHLEAKGHKKSEDPNNIFKIILSFILDSHLIDPSSTLDQFFTNNSLSYRVTLANVSLSDRCSPNPCQYGSCLQNGTGLEDWNCQCDEKHRGRRCEFGRWCNLPHITPWTIPTTGGKSQPIILKLPNQQPTRQPKIATEGATRVSGKDYCQRKLGPGFKCTDIDLPLDDNLYTEEDVTFSCSCQDDFYLSDDSKCKQAHLCNSVVCSSIGMICDETKAFNKTQPCQCNEKQDWFPDPMDPVNKCARGQCTNKQRDCGFDAHICLPTLNGERPICKCGPKFALKEEKGQKFCQSTACVLPTLNDCQQVCLPDNSNLQKPYTCSCHRGYELEADGRSCKPIKPDAPPHCKPSCNSDTQFCTESGCKCKQGYVGEGEVIVAQNSKNRLPSNISANQTSDYIQSVRCLNVCSLTYAENKEEFEDIESVCPLGLCDPSNFQCRCSDPSSSALVNTKYEPIYTNSTLNDDDGLQVKQRSSPLCHLKRVCDADSTNYKICRSQGAICVPDYTKAAMFDCICPPSTEKKFYGQGTSSEFTCESKCSAKKYDCLRRQAVCKQVDKDQVKCDCLPGLMFDQHDQKCYLAKYSYSLNLLVINRYYEPESKFHKQVEVLNVTDSNDNASTKLYELKNDSKTKKDAENQPVNLFDDSQLNEIIPQYNKQAGRPTLKSLFITDYNQCNITQVIPKSVIEDPYEHDIESFLGYIDQCNERIHANVRNYHLNSILSEDLRQALRQHLKDFTVTTNNGSCVELDSTGMELNCTIYLQSNEPILSETVNYLFNNCDKHGQNEKYCWIKPRLLLKKSSQINATSSSNSNTINLTKVLIQNELNFKQVIPCEVDNFCGQDAYSVRIDDITSLCSCKCPSDIEVVDAKDLEPRRHDDDPTKVPVKEICAPRNLCGNNSTFCLAKTGSICQYDIRLGSKCVCAYPSFEDSNGLCVEVTFNQFNNTLIVIIILLGTGLIVSIAINLTALAKSRSIFGRSKQYPLDDFPISRSNNRSTGVPNLGFSND